MPNQIDVEEQIAMTPDFFGPLLPYINDDDVTDIDYNGTDTWIRTCQGLRYRADELKRLMTKQFVLRLTQRIQTSVSKEFNQQHPLLEAETKTLRISIVHESKCNGRRSICIRKTPTSVRIDTRTSVETNYATPELLSFLKNAVKAHFNLTICGEPGTGKTELAKYVAMQIPDAERVITIEDNLEWHYHELKPNADCVEMQVSNESEVFNYATAIKACLRQNPNWIMISEVRGSEVANYMQQLSTGVHGITTVHTGDIGEIPNRLCNMADDVISRERMEGDIYTFLDIAVLVDMYVTDEGLRKRRVSQVGIFFDENGEHKLLRVFDNGKLIQPDLPMHVLAKFARGKVHNPFINDATVKECEGLDLSSLDAVADITTDIDYTALDNKVNDKNSNNKDNNDNNEVKTVVSKEDVEVTKQPDDDNAVSDDTDASSKSKPKTGRERRQFERYPVNKEITAILEEGEQKPMVLVNASLGGIYLLDRRKLKDTDARRGSMLYAKIDKNLLASFKVLRVSESPDGTNYACKLIKVNANKTMWENYVNSFAHNA